MNEIKADAGAPSAEPDTTPPPATSQTDDELTGGVVDDDSDEEHPIASAMDKYVHLARDVKYAAGVFVRAAGEISVEAIERIDKDFERASELMDSANSVDNAHGLTLALKAMQRSRRFKFSSMPQVVEQSLYLSLFAGFDVFTGDLLAALHLRKPELFDKMNRTILLSEVFAAKSLEDLKKAALSDEIESFRRKSYVEQFEQLESSFGIVLRKFDKWPQFVEATQRRNLLTHCGGVISQQYLDVCSREGFPKDQLGQLGDVVDLGPSYFFATCELMIEVAVKLGQTLWRKILPDNLEEADEHLSSTIYESLTNEHWERAKTFSEFAVSQRKLSDDLTRRIAVINLAIALKHLQQFEAAKKILSEHDWSASLPEFQLAEAVLLDKHADAVEYMRAIGKKGRLLSEPDYYGWPLFMDFREHPLFLSTYEEIYGYPFVAKLKVDAENERKALAEGAPQKSQPT